MKILITLLCLVIFTTSTMAADVKSMPKKVFISKVTDHPALDATAKGIIDGLENNGFKRGINLETRLESAQANAALASQIATKFINQNPDVVVGIGTVAAQSFAKYAQENKTKLIFSSVTAPVEASLVKSIQNPSNNTSGVSNFVAVEPQIVLFKELQAKLQRLGFLYNPGEMNSVNLLQILKEICPKLGITIVPQTANKTADVAQAATKLATQVDAIFISNDNTALGALQSVIRAANNAKIPVYLSDTDAVGLGAVAALGPNQYQVGVQTGNMIARVLNGDKLANIPVEFADKTELYLNLDAAKIVGITIPEKIQAQASKIIQQALK